MVGFVEMDLGSEVAGEFHQVLDNESSVVETEFHVIHVVDAHENTLLKQHHLSPHKIHESFKLVVVSVWNFVDEVLKENTLAYGQRNYLATTNWVLFGDYPVLERFQIRAGVVG